MVRDGLGGAAADGVGEEGYAKVREGGGKLLFDVDRFDGVVDCGCWVLGKVWGYGGMVAGRRTRLGAFLGCGRCVGVFPEALAAGQRAFDVPEAE